MMKHTVSILTVALCLSGAALAQGKPAEAPKAADPAKAAAKDAKAEAKDAKMDAKADAKMEKKADAPAMTMPTPDPMVAQHLKMFEGKWKCEGKQNDTPMMKGHPIKGKMTVKSELGGFFENVRWEESKSKDSPMPAVVQIYAGYDAAKKSIVRTDVDNMGSVAHFTTAGWTGDTLVWDGQMMGMMGKMAAKHTFTKKGEKEFSAVLDMTGPDGKSMTFSEWTCKK